MAWIMDNDHDDGVCAFQEEKGIKKNSLILESRSSLLQYDSHFLICVCVHMSVQLSDSSETLWTVAHYAPLSMGFPRQEYWSGWVAISFPRGSS